MYEIPFNHTDYTCFSDLLNPRCLKEINPKIYQGESPWSDIRKQRIQLLPVALKEAEVYAWLVICGENNNDPIAAHVKGESVGSTATPT